MPPRVRHRKVRSEPEPDPILVITIKYEGLKATQFFSKYTEDAYRQLKNDLTALGIPHPKRTNINFISHGVLDLIFPASLLRQDAFRRNIKYRVELPSDRPNRQELLNLRKQLSIVNMTIRQVVHYDPYSSILNSMQPPAVTQPLHPKAHQATPTNPGKSNKSSTVRAHPYPRPETQDVDAQRQLWGATSGKSTPSLKLHSSGQLISNEHAAQSFLDQIGNPLGVAMQPMPGKTKPTASVTQPANSITPGSWTTKQVLPTIRPTEPITPAARLTVPTGAATKPTVLRTPGEPYAPVKLERMSPVISTNPPSPPPIDFAQNGHSLHVAPQLSQSGQPTDVTFSTSPIPGLNLQMPESARIRELQAELGVVRNEIASSISRETSIVKELRSLTASDIPTFSVCNHACVDPLQKTRLQEIEKELDLERSKRLEMEAVLQDIKRERKEPFVVPALLEAFIKISKASTAAIQNSGSSQDA